MKRTQIYLDEDLDDLLARKARREGRSKASLIREAVRRQYATSPAKDALDDWAGGIDEAPGDIDAVVYDR
jgi:hypothetical protein